MHVQDGFAWTWTLEQLQVMHGLNKAVVLYLSMNVNIGVFNLLSCLPKTTIGLSVGMSQG